MTKTETRLSRVERAVEPDPDVGRIVICDLLDDPDLPEGQRRLAEAREQAGENGTIIEVMFHGQKSYSEKPVQRVSVDWGGND